MKFCADKHIFSLIQYPYICIMLTEFKKHIIKDFPFLLNSKLLIAVSGGVDSIVLTHLSHKSGLHIALAHCNFNLREKESDADEKFVVDFANELNVEVFIESFDTNEYVKKNKVSIQIAARELRYEWFRELRTALNFDYILTAHQADDNLETFLINLSRGTGLDGLTGIPSINNNIARPLLPFSREDVLQYAKENELEWREDSSNHETKYLRNKFRHEVVPILKEINPAFLSNFQNTVNYLKGTSEILENHIAEIRLKLFIIKDDRIKIPVNELLNLKPKKAYLYALFKEYGFTEWNDLESLLETGSGKQIFSNDYRMIKDRDYIYIAPLLPFTEDMEHEIPVEEQHILNPVALSFSKVNQVKAENRKTIYVDKKKLKFPLIVRKRKEGDYFYPFGMEGKKKLSKFYKDEKYSILDKENQWLLCSANKIVWVIGKRADNRFKVTESTTEIIKIKLH